MFSLNDVAFLAAAAAPAYDADAQAYITAVEAADTQALEVGVKDAINAFVVGCKADGIWTAIKASCILAGARTLTGALVPLVGAAPTNVNFVAGDYNRETGLVGNGSTKYLDSNRAGNADPQNSKHIGIYTSQNSLTGAVIANTSGSGSTYLDFGSVGFRSRINTNLSNNDRSITALAGFAGGSRTGSSSGTLRVNSSNTSITTASQTPEPSSILLFARRNATTTSTIESFFSGRLAFYSIGESLDLDLLDTRVTALINAIAAAIP
jgi:hypothetical protein